MGGQRLIEGVKVKPLQVIPDDRGRLMEILRSDDSLFERFGQVYVTTANPGVVKAWHFHKLQADHWVCLIGRARVGLYDPRAGSPTRGLVNEFLMTPEEPFLLKIPVGVYHGFKGVDPARESMIMNIPTVPYNRGHPDEYRADPYDPEIPFDWRK
ncbi:MAG: dTDP-4-dehydrorhamnose 3,5-epimerase family protein [Candidatus Omnitrophica bacterium]|nr:dTDP-4-dehydrorhamnose 3,5-epimerase family protein [Candidatus Omnitrophota bacterium]